METAVRRAGGGVATQAGRRGGTRTASPACTPALRLHEGSRLQPFCILLEGAVVIPTALNGNLLLKGTVLAECGASRCPWQPQGGSLPRLPLGCWPHLPHMPSAPRVQPGGAAQPWGRRRVGGCFRETKSEPTCGMVGVGGTWQRLSRFSAGHHHKEKPPPCPTVSTPKGGVGWLGRRPHGVRSSWGPVAQGANYFVSS